MEQTKNSMVEWIGDIPTDWELSKIGAVYEERNERVSDKDYPPLSVTKHGILPQLESAAKTNDGDNRKLIRKNDFVINSRSDRRGSCGISEYDGSCSLINTVLKPKKNMCNAYYSFVFRSERFADEFYRWGNGIVDDLWSTKWSNMKRIYIPVPPLCKQYHIADYLDRKCSQIDSIIAKRQEVIEKLKEYKLSLITEAVTKGLNPDVPMKDSGIEWIGKIPEHWNIIKLARIINSTQNGLTRRNLDKSDGQIVLKLKNISANGEISYEYQNRIELTEKELNTYSLSDGDFLFVRVNGSKSLVGKCAVFHSIGETVAYNDHIIRVKISNYCIERFLLYYLLSSSGKTEIDLHTSTAAGQYTISGEGLRDVYLTLPLKGEQKQIVNYLDNKCEQIDFTIIKKQKLIEKLTDYKKSLIYEVVTGKKEV